MYKSHTRVGSKHTLGIHDVQRGHNMVQSIFSTFIMFEIVEETYLKEHWAPGQLKGRV